MTRIEELTLDLADEVLSDKEARELQGLLTESDQARQAHIRILQIEAGLRARRQRVDLAPSVMARLRAQLADSTARDVMKEIKAQPMPDWGQDAVPGENLERHPKKVVPTPFPLRRTRTLVAADVRRRISRVFGTRLSASSPRRLLNRRAAKPAILALAACLTLVAGAWLFGPTMGEPVLAEVQGAGLSLERAGQSIPAVVGTRLQTGDLLRAPSNVTAVIGFAPENTRVTLQPGTDFRLASMSRGKRFVLGAGKIEASVARQQPWKPMIFSTAQAEARVLGTKFTLAATTNATRLEVSEGKVKLTRTTDDTAVKVGAGQYAVAANGVELAALPGTGQILLEIWTNIPGYDWRYLITHTNYPDRPDIRGYLTNLVSFEMPSNWADKYGVRLRGYIHPPKTGDYTFWLAAKDEASLWLSPDEDPANKIQMAHSQGAASRDWQSDAAQQSSTVPLTAGRRYYFEVLHKAAVGDDHLAVAWQSPGGPREVIPAEFLSPIKTDAKEMKQ